MHLDQLQRVWKKKNNKPLFRGLALKMIHYNTKKKCEAPVSKMEMFVFLKSNNGI